MKTWKRQRNEPPNHATFSIVSVFHRGGKIRQKKLTKISVTVPFTKRLLEGNLPNFFLKKDRVYLIEVQKNIPY